MGLAGRGFEPGMYPVIIALDPPPNIRSGLEWGLNIVSETSDLVSGYKIGLPLLLKTRFIEELTASIPVEKLVIADFKLADIGDVMLLAIRELAERGFNAFIVHGFVGWSSGLEFVSRFTAESGFKLITVISMTHPGSGEFIDKHFEELVELTIKSSAWGCVIGANKPDYIARARNVFRENGVDVKILSPGIGVQGVKPGSALKHGADYEIVGRAVTWSDKPREKLLEYYGEKP